MTAEPSRPDWRGLLSVVLAMGMCPGVRLGCAPAEGPRPDAPPARARAVPPGTTGVAAHQPAPLAERPWTPPTFAERQRERDEMVRVGRVVNSCLPLISTLEEHAMQEVPAWPSEVRYTGVLFLDARPHDRRMTV